MDTIRFRSLAFASTVFGRKPEGGSTAEDVNHGRKRARDWRENDSHDERGVRGGFRERDAETASKDTASKALTEAQKRKVAFFRGDINEGKKVCNAYLVLHSLPSTFTGLSNAELVDLIVQDTNGSAFEGVHIRADHVRPKSFAAILAAERTAAKPKPGDAEVAASNPTYQVSPVEARRTIFMGGLDFAENEENVRAATEAVLVRERGAPGEKTWVENVRLIRDASTGLGKGFGYVLLKVSLLYSVSAFSSRGVGSEYE
jgi:nucleolar protein 12